MAACMHVVSKIVHCYQLSCESRLQTDHRNAVCHSATNRSDLLAAKLAYKTHTVDDKCIMHLCMLLKYYM